MRDWKKVNGVEGLYQKQNGNYYLRLSKPSKTFRSLNTKQIRVAKTKAKELVLGDQEIGQSTSLGPANFTLKVTGWIISQARINAGYLPSIKTNKS